MKEEDFAAPDIVFQVGVAPRRIDILTKMTDLAFEEAWKERVSTEIDGVTVQVIGRQDFIKNKKAYGRPKDLADAAYLEDENRKP